MDLIEAVAPSAAANWSDGAFIAVALGTVCLLLPNLVLLGLTP
jgi:hypothetical protein